MLEFWLGQAGPGQARSGLAGLGEARRSWGSDGLWSGGAWRGQARHGLAGFGEVWCGKVNKGLP